MGVIGKSRIPVKRYVPVVAQRYRGSNNSAARVFIKGHASVVVQRNGTIIRSINRAAPVRCCVAAESHTLVVVQRNGTIIRSINRAAIGAIADIIINGINIISAELHIAIVAQHNRAVIPSINSTTVTITIIEFRSRIFTKYHTSVIV